MTLYLQKLTLSPDELENLLPPELVCRPQWVWWKAEKRNGKWTKIPYSSNSGDKASANNPRSWCDFRNTAELHERHPESMGIGFEFDAADPFVGVDLDHCIEADGTIASWAEPWLARFSSTYQEISPSGTGVKLIARTSKPIGKGRKKTNWPVPGAAVEMYDRGRFFTITGSVFNGVHVTADCTGVLHDLHTAMAETQDNGKPTGVKFVQMPSSAADLSDDEIIQKCLDSSNGDKFHELWTGAIPDGSHSEADLALCSLLAFFCGPDSHDRVDRLFRQSGLIRDKWNRDDYRAATLEKALNRSEFWSPTPRDPPPAPIYPFEDAKPRLQTGLLASDIINKEMPPIRWAIDGMLPEGLAVLSGRPKMGKSWIALQMAIAISNGEHLWGHKVIQGDVLYLSLEDKERRLKSRMQLLIPEQERRVNLHRLHIFNQWPRWDKGGREEISNWLEMHSDARLVIVDVWKKIAPAKSGKSSEYDEEYTILGPIQQMLLHHNIAMLVVTHNRKPSKDGEGDFVDEVLGSSAITGSADTIMGFRRERGQPEGKLEITSRDFEEAMYDLVWEDGWKRRPQGEASLTDPFIRVIYQHIRQPPYYLEGRCVDILNDLTTALDKTPHNWPTSAEWAARRIRQAGPLLYELGVDVDSKQEKGKTRVLRISLRQQLENRDDF